MNHLPPLQNIHTLANNSYNTNFDKQNRLFTEMFSNLVQQDRAISLEAWQNLPELQQSYKTFDLFADANKTRQLIDFDNVEQMQAVFDGRYKKYVNFVGGADAETLPNFINREIEYFNKWVLQSFISEYPKINIVKNHLQKYIAFVEAKLQPLAGGAPSMIKQLGINNIMNLYATSVKPPIKYDFELEMKTIFDKRYNVEITENDLLTNGFSNVAINRFFKGIVSYDDKLKLIKFIENRHKKPSPIKTDNNTPPIENTARAKTIEIIKNEIDVIDKNKGWQYSFRNEIDYNTFTTLLACYFEGSEYTLPTELISLQHGSKTRFAPIFRSIYYACDKSKIDLINNTQYFELIKIIEDYSNVPKDKLYKSIMKINKQ
jgi:hypothetical protein